jgi:Phage integrase, N-terminal SAM-like domain
MKGAIHRRSPGVFLIAIDHGRDAQGKRIRKWTTFKGTKREAQDECARLITELKTGNYLEPSKTTVAQYLEHWLTDVKTRVSLKTHERYGEICRNNIVPLLGLIRLSELKPVHISKAWAKALESGRVDGGPLSSERFITCTLSSSRRSNSPSIGRCCFGTLPPRLIRPWSPKSCSRPTTCQKLAG